MKPIYSRRRFIKTAATAGAGLALAAHGSPGRQVSANDMVRIGVIGTGDRGAWETEILSATPGINVSACCDIYPPHLKAGLEYAARGATGYDDYRKLLENKDLDAVLICTPQHLHYQMALDALDAEKHIICQKTMTLNTEDALGLSRAVKKSNRVFQVAYQWQSAPLYQEVGRLISEGKCGQITHIRCNYNRNTNWRVPVPDPKFERLLNWRMYREYSGGLMAELCSHHINIVNWYLGALPLRILGFGGIDYWKDGRETYDNVTTIFDYPGGVKATFQAITTNQFEDCSMIFMGTEGTITIDKQEGQVAHYYAEPVKVEKVLGEGAADQVTAITSATRRAWAESKAIPITVDNHTIDDFETTRAMFLDFATCIRSGGTPLSNVDNGRDVAICVDLAIEAMRKNQVTEWKEAYKG